MKKIFLTLFCCLLITGIFAQEKTVKEVADVSVLRPATGVGHVISNIPDCFCCSDSIFSLPQPPPIFGPVSPVCACDAIKFSTNKCSGANISWTVTDDKGNSIPFSGNGTNAITLNYTLAMQVASQATSLTVSMVIKCGNKSVKNTITVKLKPIPKTNISFSLSDNGNGSYTATAAGVTGNGTGWTLKEINCPGPNPCTWVPGAIKWQGSGSTFTIPNGVLVKGKCYVLTHYVNVCSPTWISTTCTVFNVTCFTLNTSAMMRKSAPIASDENDAKLILPEMVYEIQIIKTGKSQ